MIASLFVLTVLAATTGFGAWVICGSAAVRSTGRAGGAL